jgi:hypothetical protein
MKRKHDQESPRIGVITDPKKLAWLRAKIERQKAEAKMGHLGKHSSRNGDQVPE